MHRIIPTSEASELVKAEGILHLNPSLLVQLLIMGKARAGLIIGICRYIQSCPEFVDTFKVVQSPIAVARWWKERMNDITDDQNTRGRRCGSVQVLSAFSSSSRR